MKALRFTEYGAPFHVVDLPIPNLPKGHVLVKMAVAAVNTRDQLIRSGMFQRVPPPLGPTSDIVGNEGVGTIVASEDEQETYPVGTRVLFRDGYHLPQGGTWQEYVVAAPRHLLPIPAQKDFMEAAALRTAYQTALMALEMGGFQPDGQPDQVVLVPAVGSGVGNAALQLLKAYGVLETITTAGSSAKTDRAQSLGYKNVINLSQESLQRGVLRLTDAGVDIALDILGGQYTAQMIAVLNPGRALTLVGYASGTPQATILLHELIGKKIDLHAFNLLRTPQVARDNALERVLQLWQEERIYPLVDRTFYFSQAEEALDYLLHGRPFGKVLLMFDEGKKDV